MLRHSIRFKLILLLLLATIVPIVTSIAITYFYTKESIKDRSIQENKRLIFQGKTNLTNYMNSINQNSLSLYTDARSLRLIESGGGDYQDETAIYATLQNMYHAIQGAYQIHLYIAEHQRSTLFINDVVKRAFGVPQQERFALPDGFAPVVEPSHMSHNYGLVQPQPYYAPEMVLTLHRPMYRIPTQRLLGVLSIDVKLDVIRSIGQQLASGKDEQLFLLAEDGTVVYAEDSSLIGSQLRQEWTQRTLQGNGGMGSFDYKDAIYIYDRVATPYMNWTLVKRIPYAYLYHGARELTQINGIVAIVSLAIVIAATLLVSLLITSPIKRLIGYINKIQMGNLDVDIAISGSDEIGALSRRFRTMMETINNLILREYKLNLANKTNELKALQAQINPHFLNNALQSIGTLALQHDAPRVYELIAALAKMMRYSMNTHEGTVPLHREISHVKSYLELQMQRFEHQLEVSYKLDERCLHVPVPKMLLQPLAENYFKHGFEPSSRIGRLRLVCRGAEDGFLEICMEDNGKSVPADRMAEICAELEFGRTANAVRESIGLNNVAARLELYYEASASIRLENVEPHGFKVTIRIPPAEETPPS